MKFDTVMIHFGELSTKGANRKLFIQQLLHNVRVAIKRYGLLTKADRDHIYVYLGEEDPTPILERLREVAGIQRLSLVAKTGKDIGEIGAAALSLIEKEAGSTFKIETKRADKKYELDSYGISRAVATHVLKNSSKPLSVDLHHPDILLKVNLREEACYLSCKEYLGLGGYPLGMNGKVTMLLSGGIDSPVAAYALLRRGIKVECLHFASPPYTSEAVIDKLTRILGQLNDYQSDIRLDIVPFTKLQEAIYQNVPEPYCITIMRRMMVRIAVGIAKKRHSLALATGESIGQVASQTLESIDVINEVTNFPILRPLCTEDKVTIIDTAKRIGTYDISIEPYEDCCTIFKPKAPKTKPHLDECQEYEARFDYASMVEEAVEGTTPIFVSEGEVVEPSKSK